MLRLWGSGKHSDQQRKAINMGKAENNFENKWLEEREDGFFYTMKRLSLKDTQEINAGATYSAKCNYCGKLFKATYWPFLISKASAKVACEGKLHNHIINSHYGNLQ